MEPLITASHAPSPDAGESVFAGTVQYLRQRWQSCEKGGFVWTPGSCFIGNHVARAQTWGETCSPMHRVSLTCLHFKRSDYKPHQ